MVLIAAAGHAQFANLLDGILDLHLENALAEQRRGFRRIADVALSIARSSWPHLVESQHRWIEVHQARRVVGARVRADIGGAHALTDDPVIATSWIVSGDVVHTPGAAGPFLIQHVG